MGDNDGGQDNLSITSSITTTDEEGEEKEKKEQLPQTPEIVKPTYSDEELAKLVEFVQRMTILFALNQRDWSEQVLDIVRHWLLEVSELMLTIFYAGNQLTASLTFPRVQVSDVSYFVRQPNQIFTLDGFHDEVRFGTVHEDADGCLLKVLQLIYAPMFRNYAEWRMEVRQRFYKALDKLLTHLTGLHYKMGGITMLYIPYVGEQINRVDAAQDLKFVKSLETVVIYWTLQIRVQLSDRSLVAPQDFVVPAEEHEFWQYRSEVLQGLHFQLQHKEVQQILKLLRLAKSVYSQQMDELIAACQLEIMVAKSNIKYLHLLVAPCGKIERAANPAEVPPLIPRIIHLIRYIWLNSDYYNETELITVLFRDFSNQIIKYCMQQTDIDKILAGNPRFGIKMCNMSIDCCLSYKAIYDVISREHVGKNPRVGWDIERARVFNHVDAFIERLTDLIEICESMIVFGRIDESEVIPQPKFGGTKGVEFENTAAQVEHEFMTILSSLRNESKQLILNVKKTAWFDEVVKYRSTMQNLEETLQRLMSNVFANVCNIEECLEVLNVTLFYSYRASVRPIYLRQVSHVWLMFDKEMNCAVKKLQERTELRESWLPPYSSRAINYQINLERLQWLRDRLNNSDWLPSVPEAKTSLEHFEKLRKEFLKEIREIFDEWVKSCGNLNKLENKLERTLLIRSTLAGGFLECNIDRSLLSICEETQHFEHLGLHLPAGIKKIYERNDALQLMYKNIVEICISYNGVLSALTEQERPLFGALLHECDRKIAPGWARLYWSDELSEAFVNDCMRHISILQEALNVYKRANRQIARKCEQICDTPLFQLTARGAVEPSVFELNLTTRCEAAVSTISGYHSTIVEHLNAVLKEFETVIFQMRPEFYRYVNRFDEALGAALLACARSSLRNIANALRSDGDVLPATLILLQVDIKDAKISLSPEVETVRQLFGNAFQSVAAALGNFPRLGKLMKVPKIQQLCAFKSIFVNDKEALEIQADIDRSVQANLQEVQLFLKNWHNYSNVWQQTEAEFVQRIEASAQTADVFEANIEHYNKLANEIGTEDSLTKVYFVLLNQSPVKNSLLAYIEKWQALNIRLMLKRATIKSRGIHRYMRRNGNRITIVPRTLKETNDAVVLYERLVGELAAKQAEFPAIIALFQVLDKYEVDTSESLRDLLFKLDSMWQTYLTQLLDADEILEIKDEKYRITILEQTQLFTENIKENLTDLIMKVLTAVQN